MGRQRASTDLDGGILACGQIEARRIQNECLADVAEQYATTDLQAALEVCPTIKNGKWRDQCVFGVALALRPVDPDGALELCYESGRWVDYCRHDVNGEIAQVDLEHALRNCDRLEGDLLRQKTCYHGIGKYVGRVSTEAGLRLANVWIWVQKISSARTVFMAWVGRVPSKWPRSLLQIVHKLAKNKTVACWVWPTTSNATSQSSEWRFVSPWSEMICVPIVWPFESLNSKTRTALGNQINVFVSRVLGGVQHLTHYGPRSVLVRSNQGPLAPDSMQGVLKFRNENVL